MNFETHTVGALATNCYMYPLEEAGAESLRDVAVIDPGAEADAIIAALERGAYFPRYLLLTHGHFDHVFAAGALYNRYGQKPQIAIAAADQGYLGPAAYEAHRKSFSAIGASSWMTSLWKESLPAATILLEEGTVIGPLKTLLLPGHSEGSAAFYDERAGVLFAGDTLFQGGYGRTDLPGGNDQKLMASLKRLFSMDGSIAVYPGHGSPTTLEREKVLFSW